ncbi:MAG TPA: oligosaccharide flippase family protein [Candidatus Kapabacteria bacterium]|nr:oligosaccharide flippase family protein [Candidatus Kapabacteria bacterium]
MKFSKFLKDILFTGFSQVLVLLMGVIFVKIMATVLDKNSFGLLMLIRRWLGVLQPLLTLNLGLSLIKFISSNKKEQAHFFKISLGLINLIFIIAAAIICILPKTFSSLFFNAPQYPLLTIIFIVFNYSAALYLLIYSFFRGEQDMTKANILSLGYYGLPVLLGALLMVLNFKDGYRDLNFFHFLYTAPIIAAAFIYFWKNDLFALIYPLKFKLKEMSDFLAYGLNRLPSTLFLSLILGFPVFWATRILSLEVAGYIGLGVYIVRMMEIFSTPFNKIFMPKFSEFSASSKPYEVKEKSMIVVDFIITFLPTVVLSIYGLSRQILLLWLGKEFLIALPVIQIAILFSGFYIMHAIIRGLLNGVFNFPYVNIISLLGLTAVALPTIIALGDNLLGISISFGIGLFVLGISSLYILVKKLALKFPWKTFLFYSIVAAVVFLITVVIDKSVAKLVSLNIYVEFIILGAYRFFIFLAIYSLFWKKTLWYRELKKRINIPKKVVS